MKKILLITTGGTIACSDTSFSRKPSNSANLLSEKEQAALEISTISPFCLDSTDMSPKEWTELAVLIKENYELYDGFTITHGTDTLGYAAAALSCLIQNSKKPIVLTGSMLPIDAENTDAKRNLGNALAFARDKNAAGVAVVFGKFAYDGRRVSKIHTTAKNAFESVNFPPTACFDERSITFTKPISPVNKEVRFYDKLDERLEVVFLVPGMKPPLIREETRAVIVRGFGTGGLPNYNGWEKWLEALVSRGIYVIMSTQVLRGGSFLTLYEVGARLAEKYPVIDAGKMTAEYASMRTMWALAHSNDFDSFKKLFLY